MAGRKQDVTVDGPEEGDGVLAVPDQTQPADATDPAPDATDPEPEPDDVVVAPRLFLVLGNDAPDADLAPLEIAAGELVAGNRAGCATNCTALDMPAAPELSKRSVSRVFLVSQIGAQPADVLASSPLETAIHFGAGNGLHLPARSLLLKSVSEGVDDAE